MIKKVRIEGLDCPNCAKALEGLINKIDGIEDAKIDFIKSSLTFSSNDVKKVMPEIINVTKEFEPQANVYDGEKQDRTKKDFIINTVLFLFGLTLGIVCLTISLPYFLYVTFYVLSALLMGYKTYYKAITLLFKGIVNENLLVTLSIIGASCIGQMMEGLMVIALYSIGKGLESIAVNKSRKSIEALTSFAPDYANKIVKGMEVRVNPIELKIDDVIIVKPGEKVPVDGKIIGGKANLNLQGLTGESLPVDSASLKEVLSGSIVINGVLKIKVTKLYSDSTVHKILNMIENASEKKSKTETVISKVAKWYTLAVIVCAVSVWGIVWAVTSNFDVAIYRGLIFLLVSCPCAFAISVPLSYFSGLGNASKHGILIKGSNFLDACAKLDIVAFDKTGTITSGEFEVVKVVPCDKNYSKKDIIYFASLGERYSSHPLAKSILKCNKKKLVEVSEIREDAGKGVAYTYGNKRYFVGKKDKKLSGTNVEVYVENKRIGIIELKDVVKPESFNISKELNKLGVKMAILSGDSEDVAKDVATEIRAEQYFSQMLPEDKFAWLENEKAKGIKVGFVGDGINDAPSLSLADVGVSMGINGSDASVEASDIVIVDDDPSKVVSAVKISRHTRKIVWQNIILSFGIKLIFLALGTFGITGMLSAVIADVGVTLLAILNSLRALKFNPKKS